MKRLRPLSDAQNGPVSREQDEPEPQSNTKQMLSEHNYCCSVKETNSKRKCSDGNEQGAVNTSDHVQASEVDVQNRDSKGHSLLQTIEQWREKSASSASRCLEVVKVETDSDSSEEYSPQETHTVLQVLHDEASCFVVENYNPSLNCLEKTECQDEQEEKEMKDALAVDDNGIVVDGVGQISWQELMNQLQDSSNTEGMIFMPLCEEIASTTGLLVPQSAFTSVPADCNVTFYLEPLPDTSGPAFQSSRTLPPDVGMSSPDMCASPASSEDENSVDPPAQCSSDFQEQTSNDTGPLVKRRKLDSGAVADDEQMNSCKQLNLELATIKLERAKLDLELTRVQAQHSAELARIRADAEADLMQMDAELCELSLFTGLDSNTTDVQNIA